LFISSFRKGVDVGKGMLLQDLNLT